MARPFKVLDIISMARPLRLLEIYVLDKTFYDIYRGDERLYSGKNMEQALAEWSKVIAKYLT